MREDEYTLTVVIPLLRQLGYSEVTYNHGIDEFGKDIVFADYDRFGNKVYHAVQVKVGDLSGGNKTKMSDLINHVERAFNVSFEDLVTKTKVRLSHFFVIISGRFTGNARKLLMEDERLSRYLHRLHLYEGHHIQELTTRAFRELGFLLESQLAEFSWNKTISLALAQIGPTLPVTPYSTSNLTKLIDALSVADRYSGLVRQLRVYQAKLLRQNNLIALLPVLSPLHGAKNEITILKSEGSSVEQLADELAGVVRAAIAELGP